MRRVHFLNWHTLCQPKDNGGLGIRCAIDMNKALLAKIIWRAHTEPNKPWVRLLKEKYKFTLLTDQCYSLWYCFFLAWSVLES